MIQTSIICLINLNPASAVLPEKLLFNLYLTRKTTLEIKNLIYKTVLAEICSGSISTGHNDTNIH